ncbi:hypothetical protein [Serinicoccus marinus]|uniref:hypothetical protein n=1 Tax=Serinicoccus marinus TaxID=247333 RepID=UPI0024907C99|nr:hypothetical protein [Serinicoccus marinus]
MVTARAAEAAAGEQQPRVREILQDLWDQFDLPDKPKLEEQMAPGGLRACTFDTMSEIWAWAETVRLRVSEEEDPRLEAEQAELVRSWLDDHGWERLDDPAPEGDPVTHHRNTDGFEVTITPWMDARVQVDVRSPCFDDQGRRVS